MKIYCFIILSLILNQLNSKGQDALSGVDQRNFDPIIDTSKLWSVYLYTFDPYPDYSEYYKFGDTLTIEGNIYREVYKSNDSLLLSWTFTGYMRETENSEVYFRNSNGEEGLIYKFDLETNDTVVVYNPYVCPEYQSLIVSEVDTIWLGGLNRKRIFFINSFYEDYWTEGIGSKLGLIYSNCCYVGVLYNLICYYESNSLVYQNPDFTECYFPLITGIPSDDHSDAFKILYKKPEGIIEIYQSSPIQNIEQTYVRIVDLMGHTLFSEKLQSQQKIIPVYHFNTGLYIVLVQQGQTVIRTWKLMIAR